MAVIVRHRANPAIRGFNALFGAYMQAKRQADTQENIWDAQQSQQQADAIGQAIGQVGSAPFQAYTTKKMLEWEREGDRQKMARAQRDALELESFRQSGRQAVEMDREEGRVFRQAMRLQYGPDQGEPYQFEFGGQNYQVPWKEYQGYNRNFAHLFSGEGLGPAEKIQSIDSGIRGLIAGTTGDRYVAPKQQLSPDLFQQAPGSVDEPPQMMGPDGFPTLQGMIHSPVQEVEKRRLLNTEAGIRRAMNSGMLAPMEAADAWNQLKRSKGRVVPDMKAPPPEPTFDQEVQSGRVKFEPQRGTMISKGARGWQLQKFPPESELTETDRKAAVDRTIRREESVSDYAEKKLQLTGMPSTRQELTRHAVDATLAVEASKSVEQKVGQFQQYSDAIKRIKEMRNGPDWTPQQEAEAAKILTAWIQLRDELIAADVPVEVLKP